MNELAVGQPNAITKAPEPEQGSVALMRLIERAATSPDFDVAKLEKLFDVKERWERAEAHKAFVAAVAAFKKNPPEIIKSKLVAFGNTKYHHATLDQVCSVIGEALGAHGLSHRWSVEQDERAIRVSCIITHELGHSETVTMSATPDTSGQKNAIQAIGSAVSYLQRYTLLAATGLAAKEYDDDGAKTGGGTISDEQKAELIDLMQATGADTVKFLAFFRIDAIDSLAAAKFNEARNMLTRKRGQAAK